VKTATVLWKLSSLFVGCISVTSNEKAAKSTPTQPVLNIPVPSTDQLKTCYGGNFDCIANCGFDIVSYTGYCIIK